MSLGTKCASCWHSFVIKASADPSDAQAFYIARYPFFILDWLLAEAKSISKLVLTFELVHASQCSHR